MLDALRLPQPSQVIVDVAPTYNALASLASVADADDSPDTNGYAIRA